MVKHVAFDTVNGKIVSTVHLAMDHSFGSGPPIHWETMVFPAEDDFEDLAGERYASEADALAGHAALVERVKAGEFDGGTPA